MDSLIDSLSKLVLQSTTILSELKSDSMSIDMLAEKMDARNGTIQEIEAIKNDVNESMVNDEDRAYIRSLFDKYERINKLIDKALKEALRENREELTAASKLRKADDKYRVQSVRDMSHY